MRGGAPAAAHAHSLRLAACPFSIGPLIVRASLDPEMGPARVSILFGIAGAAARVPPARRHLYLLWPGSVQHDAAVGAREAALARYVEERGFDVIEEGRVALRPAAAARRWGATGREHLQARLRHLRADRRLLGLSPPATWIRVPWTPRFTDPGGSWSCG
jgi:hypothetical protein